MQSPACPECAESNAPGLGRRDFIRTLTGGAVGVLGATALLPHPAAGAAPAEAVRPPKPAENLVRELFATLTDEQKKAMVLPWAHGAEKGGAPTRLKTHNAAPLGKKLGEQFTKPQQDLIRTTFKAILSGEESYDRISRNGKWDSAGSFEGNGVAIFGDPTGKEPFSWVFAGHHLTLRCDGNSQPNTAFGGPMYYGHSANGHSETNVYNYQTKHVMSVFDMLNEQQRKQAVVVGDPGDGAAALRPRLVAQPPIGIGHADLDASQRALVAGVMRTLISPFRQEDGDEVMQLIKRNGGMEQLRLAFYKENAEKGNDRWDYWRLEGPGFVWNYRVLPHVHCFVNIVGQA
ncbi:MAG: hypothetical protein RL514_744 [Verrucomicrobiota bacterium]|jgi:hypothetical protein